MIKRPSSRVHLDKAIERLFGNYEKSLEVRSIMANSIVGQMIEGGVVKGGTSLKLRYGTSCTRATTDLDSACAGDLSSFVETLRTRLRAGWCDFSGEIERRNPAKPKNVPSAYVMQPFAVKLMYKGKSWCTVDLEIGSNEVDAAGMADYGLAEEIKNIFETLGFPVPDSVPLMKCEYQVAQKLHGLTEPGSHRVHDLIDLQLIIDKTELDLRKTSQICKRLFAYRKMQPWPSKVEKGDDWEQLYLTGNSKQSVTRSLDEAIDWVNKLIMRLASM